MTPAMELLEDLRDVRQWLEDEIYGGEECRGRDSRISLHIDTLTKAINFVATQRREAK